MNTQPTAEWPMLIESSPCAGGEAISNAEVATICLTLWRALSLPGCSKDCRVLV